MLDLSSLGLLSVVNTSLKAIDEKMRRAKKMGESGSLDMADNIGSFLE